jgi:hypothetical protein
MHVHNQKTNMHVHNQKTNMHVHNQKTNMHVHNQQTGNPYDLNVFDSKQTKWPKQGSQNRPKITYAWGGGTLVLLIITFFPQGRVSIFAQYFDGTKYVQNLNIGWC